MPIMTASNDLPPEPTSRVVTSRSLPSSRIVYFTLIPVFAVKSEGVRDAMSCICGFATIATLIVLAAVPPIAVAASDASATTPATKTPTRTFTRRRVLPFRASSMVMPPPVRNTAALFETFSGRLSWVGARRSDVREDNVVKTGLSSDVPWLYDQLGVEDER